ncbi:MAG: extracellular solute-binding protein [Patescibacteria group bacterium]
MNKKDFILFGIVGVVAIIAAVFIFGLKSNTELTNQEIKLAIWGFENEIAFKKIIDAYSQINPNTSIIYTQINEVNYEKTLLNALASGQGPDIFMLKNNWLLKHYDKISPASQAQISLSQLRKLFPQVIEQDFSIKSPISTDIYAMPLHIDTLAMIYNKDIFDAKGIAVKPQTWEEFQKIIPRLNEIDLLGRLNKTAAAIGGSEKSVSRADDLLNLIMLQFGTKMIDDNGRANFSKNEGLQAFNFYLQFSNPQNQSYTWNDNLQNSIDSFNQKNTAIIFNYASALPIIKSKNPYLDFGVSPMLQFNKSESVNYADYSGLAVSRQIDSSKIAGAWNFIVSALTNSQIMEQYTLTSGQPPALRELIDKYSDDPDLGVFAKQALTARSWSQPDGPATAGIFSKAIESALNGKLSPKKALETAESEINNL